MESLNALVCLLKLPSLDAQLVILSFSSPLDMFLIRWFVKVKDVLRGIAACVSAVRVKIRVLADWNMHDLKKRRDPGTFHKGHVIYHPAYRPHLVRHVFDYPSSGSDRADDSSLPASC